MFNKREEVEGVFYTVFSVSAKSFTHPLEKNFRYLCNTLISKHALVFGPIENYFPRSVVATKQSNFQHGLVQLQQAFIAHFLENDLQVLFSNLLKCANTSPESYLLKNLKDFVLATSSHRETILFCRPLIINQFVGDLIKLSKQSLYSLVEVLYSNRIQAERDMKTLDDLKCCNVKRKCYRLIIYGAEDCLDVLQLFFKKLQEHFDAFLFLTTSPGAAESNDFRKKLIHVLSNCDSHHDVFYKPILISSVEKYLAYNVNSDLLNSSMEFVSLFCSLFSLTSRFSSTVLTQSIVPQIISKCHSLTIFDFNFKKLESDWGFQKQPSTSLKDCSLEKLVEEISPFSPHFYIPCFELFERIARTTGEPSERIKLAHLFIDTLLSRTPHCNFHFPSKLLLVLEEICNSNGSNNVSVKQTSVKKGVLLTVFNCIRKISGTE